MHENLNNFYQLKQLNTILYKLITGERWSRKLPAMNMEERITKCKVVIVHYPKHQFLVLFVATYAYALEV